MNKIRSAATDDFPAIARLIAAKSKNPATHCIHSDTAADIPAIHNELARLTAQGELCLIVACEKDSIVGVIGCELDAQLGRGWARGPFINSPAQAWEEVADALYESMFSALPSSIRMVDSFLNIANERGNQFYRAHGFQQLRLVHVYVADAPQSHQEHLNTCESLNPNHAQQFTALHDLVFPNTYASGQRILEKLDEDHRVLVYRRGDELLGYVYATIDDDTGNGSVDYIGVHESARGIGVGRQLLRSALHWLFEIKKVPQTLLVVNDDLANARKLYESVGFHLKYTGVHNRHQHQE